MSPRGVNMEHARDETKRLIETHWTIHDPSLQNQLWSRYLFAINGIAPFSLLFVVLGKYDLI